LHKEPANAAVQGFLSKPGKTLAAQKAVSAMVIRKLAPRVNGESSRSSSGDLGQDKPRAASVLGRKLRPKVPIGQESIVNLGPAERLNDPFAGKAGWVAGSASFHHPRSAQYGRARKKQIPISISSLFQSRERMPRGLKLD
jgi:hypothetical protein